MIETGFLPLRVIKHHKIGKYKYDKTYEDRPGFIGQTYSLYSAKIPMKKVKVDKNEHYGYKWVSFEKALKMLTFSSQRMCLRKVENEL